MECNRSMNRSGMQSLQNFAVAVFAGFWINGTLCFFADVRERSCSVNLCCLALIACLRAEVCFHHKNLQCAHLVFKISSLAQELASIQIQIQMQKM